MDSEGELRNMLLVDCSADVNSTPLPKIINSPIPLYHSSLLCSSSKERALLLEKIMRHRLSDVFLSGCSRDSIPESFKKNCHALGCNLRYLKLERRTTRYSTNHSLELELSIASLHDPWPKSKRNERIVAVLEHSAISELILDTRNQKQFVKRAQEEQVVLQIESELALKIQPEIEAIGIRTIIV